MDLVVLCDVFMEGRLPLLLGGWVSTKALSEAPASWSVVKPKSGLVSDELDLRKMLDMVRLKLEVEPRVGRLDSGVGGGSWSAAGADDGAWSSELAGFSVVAEGVAAVLTSRGLGVVWAW